MNNLGNKNILTRQHARLILVHQGEENIPALINTLKSRDVHARWEAANALGSFHTQESAAALAKTLLDEDFSAGWTSEEA